MNTTAFPAADIATQAAGATEAAGHSRTRRSVARGLVAAVLAALAVLTVSLAEPASAASSITGPGGLQCERYDNKLSVGAPRVWATSRTEQVGWGVEVQRWNGRAWVVYARHYFYSSFNIYGQSVTSWTGGWYANSTMNIPVSHSGYYRMFSAVMGNQGGVTWQGLVDGGRYCYVY